MQLYRHQRDAIALMKRFKRYGLWMDTGTGKTLTCLKFLEEVEPWPTLVLCPLSIVGPAWGADAERFTPGLTVTTASGSSHARKSLRESSALGRWTGETLVTNYESLRSGSHNFFSIPWRCVILDESTRLMNPRSKTSKLVHKLTQLPSVEYVFALSGCPTPNSKMEFWSQVHAFQPEALEPNYWAFRNARFYQPSPGRASWLWRQTPTEEQRLLDDVREVSWFLKKEECLDLPPVTHEIREVELGREERHAYDTFKRDWIVRLEEGEVVGMSALSELMKLRQMTAGLARTRDGEWQEIGDSKLKALKELVQDVGRDPEGRVKPIIVVGQFRREIERIADSLEGGNRVVSILYGGMSSCERDQSIAGFRDKAIDTLVVHPASAGHGLTFVNCADMIFTSLDHSYERFYQVQQRIHRIGQTKPCTYYYLQAKNTIDQDIYTALMRKESMNLNIVEKFRGAAVA